MEVLHILKFTTFKTTILFQNLKKIAPLFSSALLSLDWSKSSDIIAGVSLAYELQFTNL